MDSAYKEDEHTYDYIDSSAFSNYAYEGHSSIQKNREVFEPTPPKRSSVSISRQNRCLFVSVIVGVIIVIITVVVVIVVKKKNESKPQAPMEFEATMTLVTPWQPEYDDPDSEIYQRFTSALLAQTEDGIRESEVGMNLDFIVISNLSPGSVICDIKIFMKTAKYSVNGASRDQLHCNSEYNYRNREKGQTRQPSVTSGKSRHSRNKCQTAANRGTV
ncbi:uncharacterized protein LOC134272574 [Saccostrea cucullata]|uniref:uncharacterized protein LOC134272574 n=1 Tax=Saccostrea cuccullata TaxID=36930 RepID=UPI002ED2DC50